MVYYNGKYPTNKYVLIRSIVVCRIFIYTILNCRYGNIFFLVGTKNTLIFCLWTRACATGYHHFLYEVEPLSDYVEEFNPVPALNVLLRRWHFFEIEAHLIPYASLFLNYKVKVTHPVDE